MSEFNYHLEATAARLIDERVARNSRRGIRAERRRHSGRHLLASGLQSLAERLDS